MKRTASRVLRTVVLAVALSSAACAPGRDPAGVLPPPGGVPSEAGAEATPGHATFTLPRPGGSAFHGSVRRIDPTTRARMHASWRPGCPVPLSALRLLTVDHWGFEGAVRRGELVVHRDVARGVLRAMRMLFEAGFPIRRMEPVDVFGGDDHRSMAADNTSSFNCRFVAGRPGVWSEHAYGRAVDLNPLENPYVAGGRVVPPGGHRFLDRSADLPGMITGGSAPVRAFAAIGWGWGGNWSGTKDYQHFSATGR